MKMSLVAHLFAAPADFLLSCQLQAFRRAFMAVTFFQVTSTTGEEGKRRAGIGDEKELFHLRLEERSGLGRRNCKSNVINHVTDVNV